MSKKETGTRATRWLQQPIAAAWQLSYPRCISCPFCASALYHPQQNLTPRTGRPLTEDSCVVSQWSNVSCLDVLLFIVNLWYFKHVGKCSVAYHCKVIEVFVIRDLTTALCYYNSAWKWNKASRFCVCVEALRSADLRGSTVLLLLFFFFLQPFSIQLKSSVCHWPHSTFLSRLQQGSAAVLARQVPTRSKQDLLICL